MKNRELKLCLLAFCGLGQPLQPSELVKPTIPRERYDFTSWLLLECPNFRKQEPKLTLFYVNFLQKEMFSNFLFVHLLLFLALKYKGSKNV